MEEKRGGKKARKKKEKKGKRREDVREVEFAQSWWVGSRQCNIQLPSQLNLQDKH